MRLYRCALFLFVVLSLTLILSVKLVSADNSSAFFGKIAPQNIQTLKNEGYDVKDLKLKSSPGLYKIQRKSVSILGIVTEPLLIKDKKPIKYYKATTVNDPDYPNQWNIPQIKADQAWAAGATGSSSVTVAVLDTGINVGMDSAHPIHEEFTGRIWQNQTEINGVTGVDDDNNGYIDDKYGWNFVDNDNDPSPVSGGGTSYMHGTLVAGVIAANANNGKGIAGIDWNAKIMPVRCLDNNGGGNSVNVAAAIEYAADNGAKVINMSFGESHALGPDTVLENAINYAYGKGVVLVAAAGNDDVQGVDYPAAEPHVIAVGATDNQDRRVTTANYGWGSNYGPELDVTAPGVSITSSSTIWDGNSYSSNSYATADGTSLATPEVTGEASLLLAQDNTLTNDQIVSKIEIWVDKVPNMNGQVFSQEYGYGRINIKQSIFNHQLVGAKDTGRIYFLSSQNIKYAIASVGTFNNWGFNWSDVGWSTENVLIPFSTSPTLTRLPNSTIDGKIYLVTNGSKQWIDSPETFNFYGFHWDEVSDASSDTLSLLANGSDITLPQLVAHSYGGAVYFIENHEKRAINSSDTFNNWGFNWNNILFTPNDAYLDGYSNGYLVTKLARDPSSGKIYLIESGAKCYIPTITIFNEHGYNWYDVYDSDPATLNALPNGADVS